MMLSGMKRESTPDGSGPVWVIWKAAGGGLWSMRQWRGRWKDRIARSPITGRAMDGISRGLLPAARRATWARYSQFPWTTLWKSPGRPHRACRRAPCTLF